MLVILLQPLKAYSQIVLTDAETTYSPSMDGEALINKLRSLLKRTPPTTFKSRFSLSTLSDTLSEFLKHTKVKIALLTGSTPKKEKNDIYKGLKEGTIHMVIGTHALIQDEVEYQNLGLVIIYVTIFRPSSCASSLSP